MIYRNEQSLEVVIGGHLIYILQNRTATGLPEFRGIPLSYKSVKPHPGSLHRVVNILFNISDFLEKRDSI